MSLFPFFLLFSLSALLAPFLSRTASFAGVVDHPGGRRLHAAPTPRVGGLTVFLPLLFALPLLTQGIPHLPLALGIGGICLLGALDDAFSLPALVKLVIQLAVLLLSTVLTWRGESALFLFFALLFLLSVTNGANFLDGADALLLGVSLPPLLALSVSREVGTLALALLALLLGFLPYNRPRAVLFLGDAGSTTLGFTMGYLSLLTVFPLDAPSRFAPFTEDPLPYLRVVVLFGVFFLDLLATSLTRVASGTSPFRPDRTHVHHRLQRAIGERRTRTLLVTLASILALLFHLSA